MAEDYDYSSSIPPSKKKEYMRLLRKAHATMDKLDEDAKTKPLFARNINILGKDLVAERYGFCSWSKIRLLDGGQEIYRLIKCEYGDDSKRKEYFFGRKFREYMGDQFSFVEYWNLLAALSEVPPADVLSDALSKETGVKKDVLDAYERFARKIAAR